MNNLKTINSRSRLFIIVLTGEDHQYKQINKKIQTTSTKCQYQIAASKPK